MNKIHLTFPINYKESVNGSVKEKLNDSHLYVSAWSTWQLAWCSNWSSSHKKFWQKEQRKIRPPVPTIQIVRGVCLFLWGTVGRLGVGSGYLTMIPNTSLTFDAVCIRQGTGTCMSAQTFPSMAHPSFTEVTHCSLLINTKKYKDRIQLNWILSTCLHKDEYSDLKFKKRL